MVKGKVKGTNTKAWFHNALIALGTAMPVYLVFAINDYVKLLSEQPTGPPPYSEHVTSFPPSYAFFVAVLPGGIAFVVALAATPIVRLMLKDLRDRRADRN